MWRKANGPVTALLASMHRLGWEFPSAQEVVDDRGFGWHFLHDSPAAIVAACKRSVRRWRLQRIAHLIPGLVPQEVDVGSSALDSCIDGTILVDFADTVASLLRARCTVSQESHNWSPS